MTDKTISPLRRRMTEDMTVQGFTPGTQRGYLRTVEDFTAFLGALRTGRARRIYGAIGWRCTRAASRRPA